MPFHHVTAGLLYKGNYLNRSLSDSDSDVLASISVEELAGEVSLCFIIAKALNHKPVAPPFQGRQRPVPIPRVAYLPGSICQLLSLPPFPTNQLAAAQAANQAENIDLWMKHYTAAWKTGYTIHNNGQILRRGGTLIGAGIFALMPAPADSFCLLVFQRVLMRSTKH